MTRQTLRSFFIPEKKNENAAAEELCLILRNILVLAATVLFAITLLGGGHKLRGVAYFSGASAYFCELLALTDCFRKHVTFRELFMALCFCPMYILLGLDYLLGL